MEALALSHTRGCTRLLHSGPARKASFEVGHKSCTEGENCRPTRSFLVSPPPLLSKQARIYQLTQQSKPGHLLIMIWAGSILPIPTEVFLSLFFSCLPSLYFVHESNLLSLLPDNLSISGSAKPEVGGFDKLRPKGPQSFPRQLHPWVLRMAGADPTLSQPYTGAGPRQWARAWNAWRNGTRAVISHA